MHRRIKEGTLELSQQEVQRNPLPNHKRKGVATMVIYVDPGEDEEENPALPTAIITTLQQSSKFKNLFDQLRLTTKERRIATEALVSIASGARVEYLSVEILEDMALLQESTEIMFSDEDIEVGYPDHRRPLYLAASINQIPIKRALVDTGPIEHFTSNRNFRKKDSGVPNGSDRIRRKKRVHRGPCSAVAESGPHSFSSSIPFGENKGILSYAIGKTIVAQAPIGSIHLSLVCKRKIE